MMNAMMNAIQTFLRQDTVRLGRELPISEVKGFHALAKKFFIFYVNHVDLFYHYC